MENEILRETVRLAPEKTDLAITVAPSDVPARAIADALEVSRSNLIERTKADGAKRGRYSKYDEEHLLPLIRALVHERPTYGYRRITALLNRQFRAAGQRRENHRRIYQIMHAAGLLLQPFTGLRIDRAHDGVVTTLRSNTRWCSDGLEIACWNHEAVRVAFIMGTCDRELIAWAASTKGFSGEMIRDILLIAVEKCFSAYRGPHRVECLSDHGSCYGPRRQHPARQNWHDAGRKLDVLIVASAGASGTHDVGRPARPRASRKMKT